MPKPSKPKKKRNLRVSDVVFGKDQISSRLSMTSPARELRIKAQELWPGATVNGRGHNWIRHQHPSNPNRFMLDASVGPIHYGINTDQEIDTAWVTSAGSWLWEMTHADFNAYINNGAYRYVDAASGEYVNLDVTALEWRNSAGQTQNIPLVTVNPAVNDDTVTWDGLFGSGTQVQVQAQTSRLAKYLRLATSTSLPIPTVGGTDIQLVFRFRLQRSNGIVVYINGAEWNERTQIRTGNLVEFRLVSTGQSIWWFKVPTAHDSATNINNISGTQNFRKTGNNLFVEIEIPYSFLSSAVYPVVVDPTIDTAVGASADDCAWKGWGAYTNSAGTMNFGCDGPGEIDAWRFAFRYIGLTFSGTIDVSYLSVKAFNDSTGAGTETIWAEDADNPSQVTAYDDGDGRTKTTNSAVWTLGNWVDGFWFDSPSLNSVLQELVDTYTISGDAIQLLLKYTTTAEHYQFALTYDNSSANAPKLHIEYTTGGTNISVSDSGSGTDAVSVSKVTNKSLAESGFGNDTFEYPRSLPSGSFPSSRLLDDFNRASLGSNWTITQGNVGIVNNKFVGLSSGTSIAIFNPATFGPEMELFCTVGNLSTGNYPAVNIDYDYVSPTQYRAVGVESIHNNGTRIFVYRTPPSVFLIDTNISYPSGSSVKFGVRHQINGDITLYFDPGTGWNAIGKANDLTAFSSGSVQLEIGDFNDVNGLVPTITVDDLYGDTLNYSPIMVSGSVSDTGRGTESLTLSATLSISDTGLGTDQVTLLQALFKTITDIATALDATVIQASSFTADSVTGQDVLTIQARFILSDAVAGIDSPSVASSLGITDGALGGDFLDLLASLSVLENGAGSDIPTSSVYVITVDVGTGTEGLVITSTVISGTTAWGQITGVLEDNIRTYANNWAGTGAINGSGDSEQICLASGQYMVSEVVYTGIASVILLQNEYASGDTVLLRYRHGATEADCLNASWNNYSSAFTSLGYVQVRIESTL